uniref:DUF551 domain-containing protein n=1 Tax=Klebsiella pneumoniae TaxID=573 RepID=UPI0035CD3C9B
MTSKFSIDNRELLQRISSGEAVVGIDFGNLIVRELAAFRLAAMDSEPDCKERKLFCSTDTTRMRKIISVSAGTEDAPLYRHAQPAPVVPDGLRLALSNAGIAAPESDEMLAATCEKHIQALVTWVKDRKPFQSAPVVPSFEEWLSAANRKPLGWVKDAMREAFDACRAAMLAAAPQSPGSEPATVPGKWIPVSERMPEDRKQVILWDAEIGEVTSGHYSHKTQTFYHCGDAIENEITHWMPPPCAPQEVK